MKGHSLEKILIVAKFMENGKATLSLCNYIIYMTNFEVFH